MKAIIRMNTIKNNPVTTEDVNIAKKIFGLDISSFKGNTSHRRPVPVIEDYIKIPRELIAAQHSITLCLNGMKVYGIPFLTTISKNILYCMAQYVEKQTLSVCCNCLGQVFRAYNLGGFQITNARCDNEFRPLMDPLANDFEVKMNYANPQEHVPEAEHNNRVIKCRILQYFAVDFLLGPNVYKRHWYSCTENVGMKQRMHHF
jgi:hypothetical protein